MSNYCTNCKWLGKETLSNHTTWLCKRENSIGYMLQSLCGNPKKAWRCKDENWYEVKVKQQEKKMTTEEMIKVMQAHINGEQIQVFNCISQQWSDITNPKWQWDIYKYRIKPEPKYRPLKPEEIIELVGTVIVDLDGDYYVVSGFKLHNEQPLVFIFQSWVNSLYLLKNFKYKDGTPVGKLEE